MSLSDCGTCWETPCLCGAEYRSWPTNKLEDLIRILKAEHASRFTLDPPVAIVPVMLGAEHLKVFTIVLVDDTPLTLRESDFERKPLVVLVRVCEKPSTLTWFDNVEWRSGYTPALHPKSVLLVTLTPLVEGWSGEIQAFSM